MTMPTYLASAAPKGERERESDMDEGGRGGEGKNNA